MLTARSAWATAIAAWAALFMLGPGVFDSRTQAAVPPPTINHFVTTNFNPFVDPAAASYDAASSTFDPASAGFDSQGWDFSNVFTNTAFTVSVDVAGLHYSLDFVHTYGLCGGMVYAALDTFLAGNGTTTPEGLTSPAAGQQGSLIFGPGLMNPPLSGPIYSYLYGRQKDSLLDDGGSALAQMVTMMLQPDEHDRETLTRHNFGAITSSIDAGQPVPLLLVEALSVGDVFMNHQVLATGYFYRGGPTGQLVVQIYDPNFPGRFMYLNTYEPNGDASQYPSEIETYDAAGQAPSGVHFFGFFTTPYSYVEPPWARATPTGNLLSDPGADWIASTWNLAAQGSAPAGSVETPAAEAGAATEPGGVTLPGWTTSGNFTATPYVQRVAPGLHGVAFPTATQSVAIGGGDNLFAGGPGSSATQLVDLQHDASLATLIDLGQQGATLSGDLGGSAGQPAEMVVTATFRSAAGGVLGSFSIGPVSAVDRSERTELLPRTQAALIPKGTRAISVTMNATGGPAHGGYDMAFADNLALTIAPRAQIHVPVTLPKPR